MLKRDRQFIDGGNDNIQAGGNVYIDNSKNYFSEYHPTKIVFYEDDICNVIDEFDCYTDLFEDNICEMNDNEFELVFKPEKNIFNNLSDEYFDTICEDFLPYFSKVKKFLELPQNKNILKKYRKSAMQLKVHIGIIRKDFEYFEEVLNYIINKIIVHSSHDKIKQNPDLVIVFINFMYWNCDIGRRIR